PSSVNQSGIVLSEADFESEIRRAIRTPDGTGRLLALSKEFSTNGLKVNQKSLLRIAVEELSNEFLLGLIMRGNSVATGDGGELLRIAIQEMEDFKPDAEKIVTSLIKAGAPVTPEPSGLMPQCARHNGAVIELLRKLLPKEQT